MVQLQLHEPPDEHLAAGKLPTPGTVSTRSQPSSGWASAVSRNAAADARTSAASSAALRVAPASMSALRASWLT